jgi:hypothetical protein
MAAGASALVVTLAPLAQSAMAVPVPADSVADDANQLSPVVIGSGALPAAPVALVTVPLRVAQIAQGGGAAAAAADEAANAGVIAPAVVASLAYVRAAPITIPTDELGRPGARAAPLEQDSGHREVASGAETKPQPEAVDPFTPFDVHGPGFSSGSGGGSPGSAASFRHFAIAVVPLRFAFPSAFAYAPLPSSVPAGTLEDAPTTRPG